MLRSLAGHGYRYATTPVFSTSSPPPPLLGAARIVGVSCRNVPRGSGAVVRSFHASSARYSDVDDESLEKKKAATKAHYFRNAKVRMTVQR